MSLYLYYHCSTSHGSPEQPSVGNHYYLVDTDDISDYDWDIRCDAASDSFEGEEGEWGDHVEQSGGTSKWVEYDPTNKIHKAHKGYEDQRPEAVIFHKELRLKALEATILGLEDEFAANHLKCQNILERNDTINGILQTKRQELLHETISA